MTSTRTLEQELEDIKVDVTFVKGMLQAMRYRMEGAELTALSVEMFTTTIQLQISVLDLVLQRLDKLAKKNEED